MPAVIGEELRKAFERVKKSVRSKAKIAGAPLFYMENGKYIREEANGEKFIQVIEANGTVKDFKVKSGLCRLNHFKMRNGYGEISLDYYGKSLKSYL